MIQLIPVSQTYRFTPLQSSFELNFRCNTSCKCDNQSEILGAHLPGPLL